MNSKQRKQFKKKHGVGAVKVDMVKLASIVHFIKGIKESLPELKEDKYSKEDIIEQLEEGVFSLISDIEGCKTLEEAYKRLTSDLESNDTLF